MYDVLDVSRYVINHSNKQGYFISNLKLQKLLYFIQVYFIIQSKKVCFKESIEAWDFGPVIPIAYREYKRYGCGHIPYISFYLVFDTNDIWNTSHRMKYDEKIISTKDKKMINKVVDEFSKFSSVSLTELSQSQIPWIEAYKSNKNNEITLKSLEEYFSQ